MFVDRQIDPVRMRLVHADFKRLVKGEKIETTVPLRLVGEPLGVREQAGVLEQIIRNLDIRCEPREIPNTSTLMLRTWVFMRCCTSRIFRSVQVLKFLTSRTR
jgi:hypothetical protein